MIACFRIARHGAAGHWRGGTSRRMHDRALWQDPMCWADRVRALKVDASGSDAGVEEVSVGTRKIEVTGLGHTCVDYIGIVPRLPAPDENLRVSDFTVQCGGPVAQALVTLARLGTGTGFIGRVGDDQAATIQRDSFRAEGVDISHLQAVPGTRSAQSIILVEAATGKRSICAYPGTKGEVALRDGDLDYLRQGRILHLDGNSPAAALAAATAARAVGIPVCLDAGYLLPGMLDLVAVTDYLITGERFIQALAAPGEDEAATAARLLTQGPHTVVVTLGERGSLTRTTTEAFATPAFPVTAVDTTGAGDVFHGAYLFGVLHGWPLPRIAEFAAATAALKCTRLGGRDGIPRLPEVLAFLAARGRDPGRFRAGPAPA